MNERRSILLLWSLASFLSLPLSAADTNAVARPAISGWITNHIVPSGDGPRGRVWYHTNIISRIEILRTLDSTITNAIPVETNLSRFTILEEILPLSAAPPPPPPPPAVVPTVDSGRGTLDLSHPPWPEPPGGWFVLTNYGTFGYGEDAALTNIELKR